MSFLLSNRALLRGILAGAVVLTGTACSRSDRTESGRDNSAAVLPDTSDAAGYRSMERDTTSNPSQRLDSMSETSAGADTNSRTETVTYEAADETADEQVVRP